MSYHFESSENGRGWTLLPVLDAARQPFDVPCVYALYLQGNLRYVGMTRCLRRRVLTHLRHGKDFDAVKACRIERYEHRFWLEMRLVARLKPIDNRAMYKRRAG